MADIGAFFILQAAIPLSSAERQYIPVISSSVTQTV